MRSGAERFVVLPFGIGCASEASITVGEGGISEEPRTIMKKKNGFVTFLAPPKPNISGAIQRLIRSMKSLSRIFVYKEEIMEEEKEMEIGFPTDVKHVTHVGLDGSRAINSVEGWENLDPSNSNSLPSISLKQFELAMVAQSHDSALIDIENTLPV